jgi:hypothetical protein
MKHGIVRICLSEDLFRKYKVYCAINDVSMTDQTTIIIKKFVDDQNEIIKIINIEKKKG